MGKVIKDESIKGRKFNRLVALRFYGWKQAPCGTRRRVWEFQCDCGNVKAITLRDVTLGIVRSCGCLSREYHNRRPRKKTQHEMYMKHHAQRLLDAIEYRKNNKEKLKESYKRRLPYYRMRESQRRAMKRSRTVNLEKILEWVQYIRSKDDQRCYYCQQPIVPSKLEIDHVVPLTRNGNHEIGNLAAACEHCNRTKFNRMPGEWAPNCQQLLCL